ncbi:MAG: prepilin peptidase [Candidatus Dactylopiibacterium sp.]|nr:prepilin peptidase [Candidatus Dactylopiibacterium sp.]
MLPPFTPVFSLALSVALGWVVLSDLLYRRIGNRLVLALLTLWTLAAGWQLAWGSDRHWPVWLGAGLLSAGLVVAVGLALFVVRWVGAGDVKLMAVLCLWFGQAAPSFLLITSVTGGLLALGLPLLRPLEGWLRRGATRLAQGGVLVWPRLARVVGNVAPQALPPGIPYGLAIAVGAGCVLHAG